MSACWVVARPGEREYFDAEKAAEKRADWLIKSKTAVYAVVYEIQVEDEGDAA